MSQKREKKTKSTVAPTLSQVYLSVKVKTLTTHNHLKSQSTLNYQTRPTKALLSAKQQLVCDRLFP